MSRLEAAFIAAVAFAVLSFLWLCWRDAGK